MARGDDLRLQRWALTWDWLKHHEAQRLRNFNFFLALTGALIVAYSQSISNNSVPLGISIGLLGSTAPLVFLVFDVRNEELMWCGRAALDRIEAGTPTDFKIRSSDRRRVLLPKALGEGRVASALARRVSKRGEEKRSGAFTHHVWMRRIYLTSSAAFVIATGWAAFGVRGA